VETDASNHLRNERVRGIEVQGISEAIYSENDCTDNKGFVVSYYAITIF
jgi:hypothetical protein